MELKVLEWNLNLRSNSNYENPDSNGYKIPIFVGDAIKNQDADIVILTEFVFCNKASTFLKKTFTDNDYDYYPKRSMYRKKTQVNEDEKEPRVNEILIDERNKQAAASADEKEPRVNEILIAWKKDRIKKDRIKLWKNSENEIYRQDCSKSEDVPNLLIIPLSVERLKLWVAGVRITMTSKKQPPKDKTKRTDFYIQQAELRYNEMKMVYYHLDKKTGDKSRVLIAGDFNNYRRGTPRKEWNFNRITCNRGDYTPYTPNGDSWDGEYIKEDNTKKTNNEDNKKTNNEDNKKTIPPAPEDHFITKNCFMENCKYERGFTDTDKTKKIYQGDSLFGIEPPNPDHAMLIGTLKF